MNVLVTGANGQLGREMRIVSQGSTDHYVFTDIAELDITDLEAVRRMVKAQQVDVIINCAAYTNVDKAESEPDQAELLNGKAPENLAIAMKEVDGLLVHISTDYVFGGEQYNTPIKEACEGKPTGVYGLTKLHGEQNIINSGVRYLIIRTGWLYSEYGKNFLKTMLQLSAERPQLKVVFDQVGTPTYAYDLAEVILVILGKTAHRSQPSAQASVGMTWAGSALNLSPIDSMLPHGLRWKCSAFDEVNDMGESSLGGLNIYHYSNEGVTSWYDFAKAIAEYAGHTRCDIQPCHSSEFPSPVKRPAYSVLDKTKIKETFGIQIPYWRESLRRCMERMTDSESKEAFPFC